ncbi:MAG TPA: flippase activity-associated protein Agl23, partial [Halococcus sp.]|nr:flippase activity-associated protein Agl23 [Halococcus sp.]
GVYWYRPIVHGPFLAIVDSYVFALVGASDFSMRLVVAIIGGLLSLSALLFRHRLRDSETVALSLLLAANPLLLYYSRFYRNDVLLAGFMLVAFGFFLRAYDHRQPANLYLGTAFFALAFTTKENALVFPVIWAGAAFLLFDRRLVVNRVSDRRFLRTAYERVTRRVKKDWRWAGHFALAFIEFFAIVVFFYAPRGQQAVPEPTLGATLSDPTLLPALVGEAVLGSWNSFVAQWGSGNEASYLSAAEAFWPVLREGGIVVLVFAVVGFLADRYAGERPHDVVAFTFFWGLASCFSYPIIVADPFPWEVLYMVVPLVVPAAVGIALVGRIGLDSLRNDNAFPAIAAALVLLIAAGQVGTTAYGTSFVHPQSTDNELVQYAQSKSDLKPLLHELQRISTTNDGTDVLFYGDDPDFDGDELYIQNGSANAIPPGGTAWFNRLPFAWYLEMYGAHMDSTDDAAIVKRIVQNDERPPIVIAFSETETCTVDYDNATDIDQYMKGYEAHRVDRFLYDSGCTISSMVVYVDESADRNYSSSVANSSATRAPRPDLSPAYAS